MRPRRPVRCPTATTSGRTEVDGLGAFAGAGGLGRARSPHPRSALGQVADLLGRRRRGERPLRGPVLELHAGTGVVTGPLTRAGVDLVAVEPGGEGRAQLRRALPGVAVVAARVDRLPLAAGRVAAVLLTDPDLLVSDGMGEELDRVLAPDGVVVLLTRGDAGSAPQLPGFGDPTTVEHAADPDAAPSLVTSWRRS